MIAIYVDPLLFEWGLKVFAVIGMTWPILLIIYSKIKG